MDKYKIDFHCDDIKSFNGLPEIENISYEITKVNTNKHGCIQEFYLLKMSGDSRVKKISVITDTLLEEQPVFHSYHQTFSNAKTTAIRVIDALSRSKKYRHMYEMRKELRVKTWKEVTKSPTVNIVDKESMFIEIDGNIVNSNREIIKPYLEANLNGTGYVYAEREGLEGTPKPLRKHHNNKFVIVDITDVITFTVKTPYSEETFSIPTLSLHDSKILEEYFLACEYVISKIWETKFNTIKTDEEHFTI